MLIFGVKYTKELLKDLGITVISTNGRQVIVEGKDGCFIRYPPIEMINIDDKISNIVDSAVDKFLKELRKEKLQKLNEIQT